uniref:2'-5' RNA ligase family protein n=1 Tax=Pseudonocardia nigra TaxID=1921578 RepID=UPI001C5F4D5A
MSEDARHHVAVRPPLAVAAPLERLRTRWDPVMVARAPAHVTVAYPEEAADPALLERRMREAAAATTPFRLALGAVLHFDEMEDGGDVDDGGGTRGGPTGTGGVFVAVEDLDGGRGG